MVEEILPNLYRIEVPLPKNPLKALNSYILKAPDRNLIVDTGMNREECRSAMRSGLRELDVDLSHTDFFITHLHADHSGLVADLATDTSTIYFNQPDAEIVAAGGRWQDMLNYARLNGFPERELREALEKHPGYRYSPRGHVEFVILKEHDTIKVGDYLFECVETPGHTRGHMCLYEPNRKILLAGDHILGDITPNISSWVDEDDPLGEYLASLDKVYEIDVELVLPGHRRVFKDCKERIRELKHHHQVRTDEVLAILEEGGTDAFQVASRMTWDITYETWEQFPAAQKWFATGEAIAHLRYLEEKGIVRRQVSEEKIVFALR